MNLELELPGKLYYYIVYSTILIIKLHVVYLAFVHFYSSSNTISVQSITAVMYNCYGQACQDTSYDERCYA
jgi:hypothetical protein